MIRIATEDDLAFIRTLVPEITKRQIQRQIHDGRLRIVELDGDSLGVLTFHVLWETVPIIELLVVREDRRGRGVGTAAVRAWEREMVAQTFQRAAVSAQANGTAQRFWRRLGYVDCGSLALPGRPTELFLQRRRDILPLRPVA